MRIENVAGGHAGSATNPKGGNYHFTGGNAHGIIVKGKTNVRLDFVNVSLQFTPLPLPFLFFFFIEKIQILAVRLRK